MSTDQTARRTAGAKHQRFEGDGHVGRVHQVVDQFHQLPLARLRTGDEDIAADAAAVPDPDEAGLEDAILARPEMFAGALTEKLLTFALGRGVEYYDAPAIRAIVRDARSQEFRMSSIVLVFAPGTDVYQGRQRLGLDLHVRRREFRKDVSGRVPQLHHANGQHSHGDPDHQQPKSQACSNDRADHCANLGPPETPVFRRKYGSSAVQ